MSETERVEPAPPPDADQAGAAVAGAAAGADADETARQAAAQRAAQEREEALRRDRLLRLMQSIDGQSDFASMKDSLQGIQKVARSDRSHARALTGLIYDDAAVVGKLLRLINAAFYSTAGGGRITDMQKAVALMGFQNVGMLASSLMIFERLPRGADGDKLRREFARSQFAALLAQDFCNNRRHSDSVFLAALFQRLGDMLAGLHFQEQAQVFEDQLDLRELAPGSPERHEAREQLARLHWGLGIEDIAVHVAGQWGWPPSVLAGMRRLRPTDPEQPVGESEYLRVLCTAANQLAGDLMQMPVAGDAEAQQEARKALVQRFAAEYAIPLALDQETLPEVVERVKLYWDDLVAALGITLTGNGPSSTKAAAASNKPDPNSQAYKQMLAENLADAVEHLSRMNRKGAPLDEVLETGLRLIVKALDLQRAIVCLHDAASNGLKGRMGVGEKAVVLAPFFDIPLQPPTELFGLLCLKNADTLITDSADPVIARRLPDWFGVRVRAGAFLVLPLVSEQKVLGMLYGDQSVAGRLVVHDRGLVLLKNLRNQVLAAMLRPAKT
jgi:HD-like signal output (HDOD) protein